MTRASDRPQSDCIDYTTVQFPSDSLTLGTLRRVEPHKFDRDGLPRSAPDGYEQDAFHTATVIMGSERLLAKHAFEKAMGRASPLLEGEHTRVDLVDDLSELYVRCGLATGAHGALELIKRLEADAAAQATAVHKG